MSDADFDRAGEKPISTGLPSLDNVLGGGLDPDRIYLVEGEPGTGKTTLALQYLLEGARHGEKGLYVTLSESARELRLVAARHGWSIDDFSVFELVPPEATLDPDRELTLFRALIRSDTAMLFSARSPTPIQWWTGRPLLYQSDQHPPRCTVHIVVFCSAKM